MSRLPEAELMQATPSTPSDRAAWLRTLALAQPAELAARLDALDDLPDASEVRTLRAPQTGMAMVRARAGGTGEQFNLGEMTLTRCALALSEGVMGVAYVQGRDAEHARRAALLDALMQLPRWRERVRAEVLVPLNTARTERQRARAERAATSKVEFFTLARGED